MTTQDQTHEPGVRIEIDALDRVNYAIRQWGLPLVHVVRIVGDPDREHRDLRLSLSLATGELSDHVTRIPHLEAAQTLVIEPRTFRLPPETLDVRTETERTLVTASLRDAEGQVVVENSVEIELLPFDHWPGVHVAPETVAAYVTPNHPCIKDLVGEAGKRLLELDPEGSFDGYRSGSRQRIASMLQACWEVLLTQGIGYAVPAPGFVGDGQRVRLAEGILQEGLATCLDSSLLIMAMAERIGLRAVLVLTDGHAIPAFWLEPVDVADVVLDDPASFRNRMQLGSLLVLESTLLAREGTFEQAAEAGREHLAGKVPGFVAIDVHAARRHRVRPLALRGESDPDSERGEDGMVSSARSDGEAVVFDPVETADRLAASDGNDSEATSGTRVDTWKAGLLDLSLRNRLINLRPSQRTCELAVGTLSTFEDELAGGKEFQLVSRGHRQSRGGWPLEAAVLDEYRADGVVHVDLPAAEFRKSLTTISRAAALAMAETGTNLLHVGVGMLHWYESDVSTVVRRAPLILVPVMLKRDTAIGEDKYRIVASDEPVRANITLLEKLRREHRIEIPTLRELPEDESGVDVDRVLRSVRQAIAPLTRWEVVDTAVITLVSFSKFLMWLDLDRHVDELRRSPVVTHLIDGGGRDFGAHSWTPEEDLRPEDIHCTRDADSSQLGAIQAAAEGRSFVLEGPPGTGKSQTIANIVADAIARRQRVLFVAEKQAALSVVKRRLEEDGLGHLCLELHSAKVGKKDVLEQISEALNFRGGESPERWDRLVREVRALGSRLDDYDREIHHPRPLGSSLHEMVGRLARLGAGPELVPELPGVESFASLDAHTWERMREAGRTLGPAAAKTGGPADHPLSGLEVLSWSFGLDSAVAAALDGVSTAVSELKSATDEVRMSLGIEQDRSLDLFEIRGLLGILPLLESGVAVPRSLLVGSDALGCRSALVRRREEGGRAEAVRSSLLLAWRPPFLERDVKEDLEVAERIRARPSWIAWFPRWRFLAAFRRLAVEHRPTLEAVVTDLERVKSWRQRREGVESDEVSIRIHREAGIGEEDWDAADRLVDLAERLHPFVRPFAEGFRTATPWGKVFLERVLVLCEDPSASLRIDGTRDRFLRAWRGLGDAWARLAEHAVPIRDVLADVDDEPGVRRSSDHDDAWADQLLDSVSRWRSGLDQLESWCRWCGARRSGMANGLGPIVRAIEEGVVAPDEVEDGLARGVGRRWFQEVANGIPAIRNAGVEDQSDLVDRFCRSDRELLDATEVLIRHRSAVPIVSPDAQVSGQSELGLLRRELAKQRRHLPVRKLIAGLPTLLPTLKPCFLMSPLSVAQFLDPTAEPFDLVIFDEASQIPVCDAIGAIGRARSAIVVGDSRQLPPTRFFAVGDDEDRDLDFERVEDMESILQEACASGLPSRRLQWHYRSRHESLIAFSNARYYGSELRTFPSPAALGGAFGLVLRHIEDGCYDRGGNRTNLVEATAVVRRVVSLLREGGTPSIGVVTFNVTQQTLIEDLLDAERRQDPAVDMHFTEAVPEPVFVKNLENVQGDERDTIIFSVGYGRDDEGRMAMNFGPLNKDGGERRLNVAVTRARERLEVFSSIRSDDIDLRRTNAMGVRDLRTFLECAEHGPSVLPRVESAARARALMLEEALATALAGRGWDVEVGIGCGSMPVGLGVRCPKDPGRFVLGIEIDGGAGGGLPVTRDRERIRPAVLRGLGWRIHELQSVEWFKNPEACLDRIEQALQSAGDPADGGVSGETRSDPHSGESGPGGSGSGEESSEESDQEASDSADGKSSRDPSTTSSSFVGRSYRGAVIRRSAVTDLDDPDVARRAREILRTVVRAEMPCLEGRLVVRLSDAFGDRRATERFREFVSACLRHELGGKRIERRTWGGESIIVAAGATEADLIVCRPPGDGDPHDRSFDDVPLIELAVGARSVIDRQFGMPIEELCRETARILGVHRMSSRIRSRIEHAVDQAVIAGWLLRRGDSIQQGSIEPSVTPTRSSSTRPPRS